MESKFIDLNGFGDDRSSGEFSSEFKAFESGALAMKISCLRSFFTGRIQMAKNTTK